MKVFAIKGGIRDLSGLKRVLAESGFDVQNVGGDNLFTYIYLNDGEQKDPGEAVRNFSGEARGADAGAVKRNLLFYIYPVKQSCWPWHFDQLEKYKSVFNGKRVVVVATDEKTVSFDEVRDRAAFLSPVLCQVKNDTEAWETIHFHSHLSNFESLSPNEILFYAHGKGVRHPGRPVGVMAWSESMYRMNLSCPELIDKIARRYKAIGAFRRDYAVPGGDSWHFSGTFFWLRHDALFSSEWKKPLLGRYGVEGFPGRIMPIKDSFDLTDGADSGNLYEENTSVERCGMWLADLKSKVCLMELSAP